MAKGDGKAIETGKLMAPHVPLSGAANLPSDMGRHVAGIPHDGIFRANAHDVFRKDQGRKITVSVS